MIKDVAIRLLPEELDDLNLMKDLAGQAARIRPEQIEDLVILKRSVDARGKIPRYEIRLRIFVGEKAPENTIEPFKKQDVSKAEPVIIVGAGPAGLFAALRLIELGLKPIILERGKDVRGRRRDLAALNKDHIVDPDSNYCFGEGGAGTYSDGKLYTRSKKRGAVTRVMELLTLHGADPEIMINSHPHIGTNKLPAIITQIRENIEACGGEVHFGKKVIDIIQFEDQFERVQCEDTSIYEAKNLILATGHSARDVFSLLKEKNIKIEAKPFAIGVRVEHPQDLIDRIQYKMEDRGELLPAAPYSLVCQVDGKGVYSFCMCPGGIIAPCATEPGEIVTNGWSPSKRDQATANSGIVVEISLEDLKPYAEHGELAGVAMQKEIEQKACEVAGGNQTAPAQRLVDFLKKQQSKDLPKTSYLPGVKPVNMDEFLPEFICERLRAAFIQFEQKMPGFIHPEAVILGPESRTSSPVRIPRDHYTLEHTELKGFYPCGEGAGYAGGIVSAGVDGWKVAEKIAGFEPEKKA